MAGYLPPPSNGPAKAGPIRLKHGPLDAGPVDTGTPGASGYCLSASLSAEEALVPLPKDQEKLQLFLLTSTCP